MHNNEWPWQKKLTQKVYPNPKVVIMAIAIIDFKVAQQKPPYAYLLQNDKIHES